MYLVIIYSAANNQNRSRVSHFRRPRSLRYRVPVVTGIDAERKWNSPGSSVCFPVWEMTQPSDASVLASVMVDL
jgi:hypothetical protein